MKIALIGYGNMGQEIAQLVEKSKKHTIVSISYKKQTDLLDVDGIKNADVVIDFTSPEIVFENIKKIANIGKHMVIGTTGWHKNFEDVKKIVKDKKIGLIYGGNFSIGANIYFQIIAKAATLFSKYEYDVYGYEIHHAGKKDSPSGTAKTIGDIIMRNNRSKRVFQNDSLQRQIFSNELHFASIRGGRNPGYHEVIFDSIADEVRISHSAHGRHGFAEGAIFAAEFVKNKKGMFEFSKVFNDI